MTNNSQPISEKKAAPSGMGCLVVFFSIFFIVGLILSWTFLILPVSKIIQAQTWRETPCTIISSSIAENKDSDGDTYKVNIQYKYEFNDLEYTSNQYDFITSYSSGYKSKAAIVKDYPPNQVTVCYVNSNNPSQAVINRGLSTDLIYGIIPVLFVFVGLGGISYAIHSARKIQTPSLDTVPQKTQFPTKGVFDKEAIALNPTVSPYQKMLTAGFVCLFWNGMIGMFILITYINIDDVTNKFLLLLFIPFILVGLLLIHSFISSVRAIFAPRPEFFVDRSFVPLGSKLKLSWVISGNPLGFRNMTINLQGYEESKYRRGTDTYTDKETFYQKELFNSSNLSDIVKSHIIIDIPSDSVPTFISENNKIVWCVLVKATIDGWANLDETYDIIVTPISNLLVVK